MKRRIRPWLDMVKKRLQQIEVVNGRISILKEACTYTGDKSLVLVGDRKWNELTEYQQVTLLQQSTSAL